MQDRTYPWTAPDGEVLFARVWQPDGSPRAHVALVHGYAEHSGRYGRLVGELCARGFAVHAFDWRGHGRSPGVPGYVEGRPRLVRDVREFVEGLPRPTFLFGHSAGGAAAVLAATQLPGLSGLVLSSPYLVNAAPVSRLLLWVGRWAARAFPRMPTTQLELDALSRDPAAVRGYREDPLVYTGRVRARTGVVLLEMGAAALASAPDVRTPLLIVHGEADRIASPTGSHRLTAVAGSADKRLELVAGGYHELLHDLERARIAEAIVAWLERRA